MKLKPLADRVLLKATEAEETTKSGIILSTANKEKPVVSEVIAVGPGGMVDGKLMVDTLNQELSNHLLQTVRNLCDQHLQKAAEKDQPNVSAGGNDKKKKKSNSKPKMGVG